MRVAAWMLLCALLLTPRIVGQGSEIFFGDFETGDFSGWSSVVGGVSLTLEITEPEDGLVINIP